MQRAAVLTVALCSGLWWCQPSYAGIVTRLGPRTLQTSSGQWGAVPSTTTLTYSTATQRIFFTVTNVGSLSLRGATYSMSITNITKSGTLWLLACVGGTWNTSTGACVGGTQQTIGSTTGAATNAATTVAGTYPAAAGSTISLQAYVDKNSPKAVATIGISVDRTQVRPAVVTNA